LGLQYLDLFLIHVPVGMKKNNSSFEIAHNEDGSIVLDYDTDLVAVWKVIIIIFIIIEIQINIYLI
jgi:diketogulonate reductase-like aldo/keto reductase